jgi:hypothetical protein
MLDFLAKLFRSLVDLWNKIPDSAKAAIIAAIVEIFDAVFRAYFKDQKDGNSDTNPGEAHA